MSFEKDAQAAAKEYCSELYKNLNDEALWPLKGSYKRQIEVVSKQFLDGAQWARQYFANIGLDGTTVLGFWQKGTKRFFHNVVGGSENPDFTPAVLIEKEPVAAKILQQANNNAHYIVEYGKLKEQLAGASHIQRDALEMDNNKLEYKLADAAEKIRELEAEVEGLEANINEIANKKAAVLRGVDKITPYREKTIAELVEHSEALLICVSDLIKWVDYSKSSVLMLNNIERVSKNAAKYVDKLNAELKRKGQE